MRLRFGITALVLALSFFAKFWLLSILNWSPDLVLAALLTAAFFVDFREYAVLLLASLWFMNWQPGLHPEIVWLGLLLSVAFFAHYYSPWQSWLSNAVFTLAVLAAFYGLLDLELLRTPGFWLNVGSTAIYGAVTFFFLQQFVGRPSRSRQPAARP